MSINEQENFLNSFIDSGLYSKLINHRVNDFDENNIYIVSDTHDDYFSLLGSLVESGTVKIEKDNFQYYDIKNMNIVEKSDINAFNRDNIIVIFNPIISDNIPNDFYHLGDIIDRGSIFESFRSLIFLLSICTYYENEYNYNPLHLVLGNHESEIFFKMNMNILDINLYTLINIMFTKKYLSTGYNVNIGGKPTGLWHSALNMDKINSMLEVLCFSDFEYLNECSFDMELFDKIIQYYKTRDIFIFDENDMINLKIEIGNLSIRYCYDTECFSCLYHQVENRGYVNTLFWDDFDGFEPIVNQIVGHRVNQNIILTSGKNCSVLEIDTCRSRFYYSCKHNYGNINTIIMSKQKNIKYYECSNPIRYKFNNKNSRIVSSFGYTLIKDFIFLNENDNYNDMYNFLSNKNIVVNVDHFSVKSNMRDENRLLSIYDNFPICYQAEIFNNFQDTCSIYNRLRYCITTMNKIFETSELSL